MEVYSDRKQCTTTFDSSPRRPWSPSLRVQGTVESMPIDGGSNHLLHSRGWALMIRFGIGTPLRRREPTRQRTYLTRFPTHFYPNHPSSSPPLSSLATQKLHMQNVFLELRKVQLCTDVFITASDTNGLAFRPSQRPLCRRCHYAPDVKHLPMLDHSSGQATTQAESY